MACVATRTGGGELVDCDNIPKCDMTASCTWTLQWNYKITNKCQNPAVIENFETTLCHGHCKGGMNPYGECLGESSPDCTTYGLADIAIQPSGQTIDAGGTKVASVNNWIMVVDLSMEGAKAYGNSTVVLNTTQGIVRPGEASKCIDLCDKDLMSSRAEDTGGISNGENAVIVDSIITDEETLATLPISVIPTSTPTVNQESNKRPQTDIPTDALNIIAETNTNPVPCKVSVSIWVD